MRRALTRVQILHSTYLRFTQKCTYMVGDPTPTVLSYRQTQNMEIKTPKAVAEHPNSAISQARPVFVSDIGPVPNANIPHPLAILHADKCTRIGNYSTLDSLNIVSLIDSSNGGVHSSYGEARSSAKHRQNRPRRRRPRAWPR